MQVAHKVRYYEYLSQVKIDMIYSQIDTTTRPTSREVSVDFKLVKTSRKTDGIEGPTVYQKLDVVEDWIYEHEPPGTMTILAYGSPGECPFSSLTLIPMPAEK